jgi:transcriptional regulator with XRE-family HTH domain
MSNAAVVQPSPKRYDVPGMVRAAMRIRRKTGRDLTEVLHLSEGPISERLNGLREFRIGELEILAGYLDVDIEFFFQSPESLLRKESTGAR